MDIAEIRYGLTYLYLRFDGRISRKFYWIGTIILMAVETIYILITNYFERARFFDIIGLIFLYPEFAVILKRAHDCEIPSWIPFSYLLLSVALSAISILGLDGPDDNPSKLFWLVGIPGLFICLCLIGYLGFRKGTGGPNRFGPAPA